MDNTNNLGESFSAAAEYEESLIGALVRLTSDPELRAAFEEACAYTGIDSDADLVVMEEFEDNGQRFIVVQDSEDHVATEVVEKFDLVEAPIELTM